MATMKSFWAYLCFIFTWWGVMSGALTIPFAAMALVVPGHPQTYFIVLAFSSLLIASAGAAKRNHDLREILRPKLRIACSPKISCCRTFYGDGAHCVYRIRVINGGREPITNCKARLTGISRDGQNLWDGDSPQLTFTPSEGTDTLSKTLEYEVNHTIDVLFLYRDRYEVVAIGTHNLAWGYKKLGEIFSKAGDYRLHVKLSGDPMVHASLVLRFNWTCNFATSELWLECVTPEDMLDPNP